MKKQEIEDIIVNSTLWNEGKDAHNALSELVESLFENKPKPCSICKGEAEVRTLFGEYYITCDCREPKIFKSKEEAIGDWNDRSY